MSFGILAFFYEFGGLDTIDQRYGPAYLIGDDGPWENDLRHDKGILHFITDTNDTHLNGYSHRLRLDAGKR
jgi:hypothetical protein